MLPVDRHLPGNPFHQPPILLQAFASFLQLGDGQIILVLHLGDRVGSPEKLATLLI